MREYIITCQDEYDDVPSTSESKTIKICLSENETLKMEYIPNNSKFEFYGKGRPVMVIWTEDLIEIECFPKSQPRIYCRGWSRPIIECKRESTPEIDCSGYSRPTINCLEDSRPTITCFGVSAPTIDCDKKSNPTILALDRATIFLEGAKKVVHTFQQAIVRYLKPPVFKSAEDWLAYWGIPIVDGKVRLVKVVNKNLQDTYMGNVVFEKGKTIVEPKYPGPFGLLCSPLVCLSHYYKPFPGHKHVLVEVDVNDIIPEYIKTESVRVKKLKVLEVYED